MNNNYESLGLNDDVSIPFTPLELDEDLETSIETEKGKIEIKGKSTTVLMTVGMIGFFILYGIGMILGHIEFKIADLIGGIISIGAIFGLKKWQRQNGNNNNV